VKRERPKGSPAVRIPRPQKHHYGGRTAEGTGNSDRVHERRLNVRRSTGLGRIQLERLGGGEIKILRIDRWIIWRSRKGLNLRTRKETRDRSSGNGIFVKRKKWPK